MTLRKIRLIAMAPTFLILLGAAIALGADVRPDRNFSLLPPVNFTIHAAGLAQVLLRWDPNPDQEPVSLTLGYHVKVHAPEDEDYQTKNTESKRVAPLHRGFSASVRTVPWEEPSLLGDHPFVKTEELSPTPVAPGDVQDAGAVATTSRPFCSLPSGSPGTAAVNLTCSTSTVASNGTRGRPYHVSLRCAWLGGAEAPADTQYFLRYRRPRPQRPAGGHRGHEACAPEVSAGRVSPAHGPLRLWPDRVNPPGNVTAEVQGSRLHVRWEKPVSAFPGHCFEYEVKIQNTRKRYLQTEKMTTNEFTTTVHDISKYCIEVRAAVSSVCREGGLWGEWSPAISVGNEAQKPWTEWYPITLVAALCLAFVSSLACRTCHVWTKLFPPVPGPKSHVQDFAATVNYEKSGSRETESEVISYVEEPGLEVLEDLVF
ncbi:PREDICTED: interleukin-5 receptor subunit alpha [Myotis davidii]|uniref:interleukin-5 receptor subunit alpha n=1 Tax=Myotis davidii TaxID=225400 RepID=UPI000767446F|nr:PREDICTED: interleukin-5 receptor subunit alpha [Myotis davidii]